jgi:hypothetical protein
MFVEINNTLYTRSQFLGLIAATRKVVDSDRADAMWRAGVAAGIPEQTLADAFCGLPVR